MTTKYEEAEQRAQTFQGDAAALLEQLRGAQDSQRGALRELRLHVERETVGVRERVRGLPAAAKTPADVAAAVIERAKATADAATAAAAAAGVALGAGGSAAVAEAVAGLPLASAGAAAGGVAAAEQQPPLS